MPDTPQKLPAALPATAKISVLLVSPISDDELTLRRILATNDSSLTRCGTVQDAMPQIQALSPAIVVCEGELADGSWKSILSGCEPLPKAPLILVTSRHADDKLWAEVLNLGGYDVLMKPFDAAEVNRILTMTWRQWSARFMRQPVASAPGAMLSAQLA